MRTREEYDAAMKTRWCKQCKTDRPETEFLPMRQPSFRVVICDRCAQANMAKWNATQNVGLRPDQVKDAGE